MSRRTTRLAAVLAASADILALLAAPGPVPVSRHPAISGVIKTVPRASGDPGAVNFNQGNGEIYMADSGAVTAINSRNYHRSAAIKTDKAANGIAVNPGTNTTYVANTSSYTLSVMNGGTRKVTADIKVAPFPISVCSTGETAGST
jgi:YVTN family beta-propeller protein